MKVLIRYNDLWVGIILTYFMGALFLGVIERSYPGIDLNVSLFWIAMVMFYSGGFFGNLFCEKKNEVIGYILLPISIQPIVIFRCLSISLLVILIAMPAIIFSASFFNISSQQLLHSFYYYMSSLSVCIVIGTLVSTTKKVLLLSDSTVFGQWMVVAMSPIPYVIFIVWLNSVIGLILLIAMSFALWFYLLIPLLDHRARKILINLK